MSTTAAPPRKYLGQTVDVKPAHRIDEARLAHRFNPVSADPLFALSTDGDRATRTGTWDIGADESTTAL